jgi:hypothetical protein
LGTAQKLGVYNVSDISTCAESWSAHFGACSGGQQLLTYVDANNCGTTLHLPSDHNTYVACGTGGAGGTYGGISGTGSVLQSALPSAQPSGGARSVLANFFSNIWAWFVGLFS